MIAFHFKLASHQVAVFGNYLVNDVHKGDFNMVRNHFVHEHWKSKEAAAKNVEWLNISPPSQQGEILDLVWAATGLAISSQVLSDLHCFSKLKLSTTGKILIIYNFSTND